MEKKSLMPTIILITLIVIGLYVASRRPYIDQEAPREKQTLSVEDVTQPKIPPLPPLQYVQIPDTMDCYVVFPRNNDSPPSRKPIPCDTVP